MATRTRTATKAAAFDNLSSAQDKAAPVQAKAVKAATSRKGRPAPAVQAAPVAPAPVVNAPAPAATPALVAAAKPRPYVYPGDRNGITAGVIINAMLQRPNGATTAEMVDALVANMPDNYGHNIKAANAKAHSHPRTVASYAAKCGHPGAVTLDPAGRYRCQDAAKWQTLAKGGKCSGGQVVRVDDNGKPLARTV